MEQLYHKTNRHVMELQDRVNSMTNCYDDGTFESLNLQTSQDIRLIHADLDRLESQASREVGSRKATAKMKVDQLRYDLKHIQSAIQSLINKRWKFNQCVLISIEFNTSKITISYDKNMKIHNK